MVEKKSATKKAPAKKVAAKKAPAKKAVPKKATPKTSSKETLQKKSGSPLFAVIETGGKQYKVSEGDVLKVEKLPGKKEGSKLTFDKVLLVDNGKDTQIGDPYLKGAKVEALLEEEGLGKKVRVVRFKSKSRYLKQKGHRQPYAKVKIGSIK